MIKKYMLTVFSVVLLEAICSYPGMAAPISWSLVFPLTPAEVEGVLFTREEEKLARDSYMVLSEKWGLAVFDNIALSEQKHMDAIKNIILRYSLSDPVLDEAVIDFFVDEDLQVMFEEQMALGAESAMAALYVGAFIEETDMRDIQALIDKSTHGDLIYTYESLLCGSRNHLRAFVKTIELRGEVYEAIYLTEEELSAIVDSPVERSCGRGGSGGQKGNRGNSKNGR